MIRTGIVAAAAAAFFALTAPGPAQAAMANPGLNAAVPAATENVQYYYGGPRRYRDYRRWDRPRYRHSYRYRPYRAYGFAPSYRRCWTVFNGYRYVRRCR